MALGVTPPGGEVAGEGGGFDLPMPSGGTLAAAGTGGGLAGLALLIKMLNGGTQMGPAAQASGIPSGVLDDYQVKGHSVGPRGGTSRSTISRLNRASLTGPAGPGGIPNRLRESLSSPAHAGKRYTSARSAYKPGTGWEWGQGGPSRWTPPGRSLVPHPDFPHGAAAAVGDDAVGAASRMGRLRNAGSRFTERFMSGFASFDPHATRPWGGSGVRRSINPFSSNSHVMTGRGAIGRGTSRALASGLPLTSRLGGGASAGLRAAGMAGLPYLATDVAEIFKPGISEAIESRSPLGLLAQFGRGFTAGAMPGSAFGAPGAVVGGTAMGLADMLNLGKYVPFFGGGVGDGDGEEDESGGDDYDWGPLLAQMTMVQNAMQPMHATMADMTSEWSRGNEAMLAQMGSEMRDIWAPRYQSIEGRLIEAPALAARTIPLEAMLGRYAEALAQAKDGGGGFALPSAADGDDT